MEDFSRQMEIFDPRTFKQPVHVIGCGATGSWVAMLLAKLGIKDIHLHDFDIVEEHNLPNQLFMQSNVGDYKSTATATNVANFAGYVPNWITHAVTGDTKLSGYVFILTDTMKSREEIYRKACKNHLDIPLVIETRTCVEGGRVYALNPSQKSECTEYEKTLYKDEEAVTSVCGIIQSLAPTSALMASIAVWQLIKHHNNVEIDNEILLDVKSNTFLTRRF